MSRDIIEGAFQNALGIANSHHRHIHNCRLRAISNPGANSNGDADSNCRANFQTCTDRYTNSHSSIYSYFHTLDNTRAQTSGPSASV